MWGTGDRRKKRGRGRCHFLNRGNNGRQELSFLFLWPDATLPFDWINSYSNLKRAQTSITSKSFLYLLFLVIYSIKHFFLNGIRHGIHIPCIHRYIDKRNRIRDIRRIIRIRRFFCRFFSNFYIHQSSCSISFSHHKTESNFKNQHE